MTAEPALRPPATSPDAGEGRVLHVNVSAGGVPKRSVREAAVGPLGLEGDGHTAYWTHGGPLRAVCLLAIEAIERVQADGHPIEPGSTGENVTTTGIELARLPAGTRLAIGDEVLLEVTTPAMPCDTIKPSFRDGRSGRISILLHPDDSRIYTRVLRPGAIREGDPIRVLPADPASDAPLLSLLARIASVERHSAMARWMAAERLGYAIEWVDRGDLAYGVSREPDGPVFSFVHGMRVVPNLLPMVLARYDEAGAVGYVDWPSDQPPPWPGAVPDFELDLHVASPDEVLAADAGRPDVDGLTIREVGPDEADRWSDAAALPPPGDLAALVYRRTTPIVAAMAGHHLVLAEVHGAPAAAGLLVRRGRAALIRAGGVHPAFRGRGIQRALIRARAEIALANGCDVVASQAEPGSISARNLLALGFRAIHRTAIYRYAPGGSQPDAG